MAETRILFVDDEEGIRRMLSLSLKKRGYDVAVAATVAEALAIIASSTFDVLLTDLNIGEPGDGFTVVSAMRRTQPQATTLILTAYPDFDSALNAIRNQVDDYIIKPPNIDKLVETIEAARKKSHRQQRVAAAKRVADLVEENGEKICQNWLSMVEANQQIRTPAPCDGWMADAAEILAELVRSLRSGRELPSEEELCSAMKYGKVRREQGYSITELIEESRMLHRSIYDTLQGEILVADLSWLIRDMMRVGDSLQGQLVRSVEGYMAR